MSRKKKTVAVQDELKLTKFPAAPVLASSSRSGEVRESTENKRSAIKGIAMSDSTNLRSDAPSGSPTPDNGANSRGGGETFKPGIYSCHIERYHAANGVSKSMLDTIAFQTPAHLRYQLDHPEEQTRAQEFGVIVHRALLEPDTFKDGFHVRPFGLDLRTKDGKEWKAAHSDKPDITLDQAQAVADMVSSVHTHPFAKRLLKDGEYEQSLFVESDGILRKSRLDALVKGNVIPDLKTCESASLPDFQRNVSRYRYHVQAAFYLDNCNLLGIEKDLWFFIAVEKSPPYMVRCLKLDGAVINAGREAYKHDLEIYRQCLESGIWPDWGEGWDECFLPDWEMRRVIETAGGEAA